MKAAVILTLFLTTSWLSAQDLPLNSGQDSSSQLFANPMELPEVLSVEVNPDEPALTKQLGCKVLNSESPEGTHEEIPEMATIRNRTVYHLVARSESIPVSAVNGERIGKDLQTVSAVYRAAGQKEAECVKPAISVAKRIEKKPAKLLQIVDLELRANPDCACEIVKSAIRASDMKTETVVAIVKVAIEANPESMRLVAQCAIAASPESLSAIQDLLAEYGASLEGYSAKSAKGEKAPINDEVAAAPNPLDFPGGAPWIGPGSSPIDNFNLDLLIPPTLVVTPPNVTSPNP